MCVHGEIWPLENATLFTYGNRSGGYSRGASYATVARLLDDGIEVGGALRPTASGKQQSAEEGFSPWSFQGRWPGPLVAWSADYGGSRAGPTPGTVWTHDDTRWKVIAWHGEAEPPPEYWIPTLFRGHVIVPKYENGRTRYVAFPPLEGLEKLQHGSSDAPQMIATSDAIYAIEESGSSAPNTLLEWRDGKVTKLGEVGDGSRLVVAKNTVVVIDGRNFWEIVGGKMVSTTPSESMIATLQASSHGDLWIETRKHEVFVAHDAGGAQTKIEALPLPVSARIEDASAHEAMSGGLLAGAEFDDVYAIGNGGALYHRVNNAWIEVPFPKPPWATNAYRAQTLVMHDRGDLFVNAAYGERGLGWKTPERYRAVLRTKRPHEVLRCNEPDSGAGWDAGGGFMSFAPLADDSCATPFVMILRTAYGVTSKKPHVVYDAKAQFPGVRASFAATKSLGDTLDLVEFTAGDQRYLGAAVSSVAVGREFITTLAKKVEVLPELRPELVCGQPKAERTITLKR